MEIEFAKINGTPVLTVAGTWSQGSRVYGATLQKKQNRWVFPAFPPFVQNVLHDLPKVYKHATLTDEVTNWLKSQKTQDEWLQHMREKTLPLKSYDHQLVGTAELLYNYRWILQWDTGTGKTKPVIDAAQQLHCKMLVLCPLVALDNWVDECEWYTDKTLKAVALKGYSRERKLRRISEALEADVMVVTFDFAKRHGIPKLHQKTRSVFKAATHRVPHQGVLRILKRINDSEVQSRLAADWVGGRKPADINKEVSERIHNKPQWLIDFPYDTITADESHRLKNRKSQRTKICLELSKPATRRYLLTATLSQGNPWDLYPQGRFLAPYFMPEDSRTFGQEYIVTARGNPHLVVGYKKIHILNARIASVSSEKKLDDCVDIPPRRFEPIHFPLTNSQRKDYNYIVNQWAIERPNEDPLELANGAVRLMKLLQLCSGFVYVPENDDICDTCDHVYTCVSEGVTPGTKKCTNPAAKNMVTRKALTYADNPKLKYLEDKVEDIVQSDKVIIWAVFEEELDVIEKMLKRRGWGYVRVDGKTTKNIRALAKQFNTDASCAVYLAQISTGITITLNAAKYAIYYSRSWSLDDRIQSLGRNRRIGQDKKTVVYDLCAEKTLEVQQLNALQNKDDIAKLLTRRIRCTLCAKYSDCRGNNIEPWAPKCVLSTEAERTVARAEMI